MTAPRTPTRPLVHGSRYGYLAWACRCRPCMDAHARYSRARYAAAAARDAAATVAPWVPREGEATEQRMYGGITKLAAPRESWWTVPEPEWRETWQAQVPRWMGTAGGTP